MNATRCTTKIETRNAPRLVEPLAEGQEIAFGEYPRDSVCEDFGDGECSWWPLCDAIFHLVDRYAARSKLYAHRHTIHRFTDGSVWDPHVEWERASRDVGLCDRGTEEAMRTGDVH